MGSRVASAGEKLGEIVSHLPWWAWVVGVLILILAIWWITTRLVSVVRRRARAALEGRRLADQRRRAARDLVRADESLQTAERERDYVIAQHGEAAAGALDIVLETCRTRLQSGFALLNRLADTTDASPQTVHYATGQILGLCARNRHDLKRSRSVTTQDPPTEPDAQYTEELVAARDAAIAQRDALIAHDPDGGHVDFDLPSAPPSGHSAAASAKDSMLTKALWGLFSGGLLAVLFNLGVQPSTDVAIGIVIGGALLGALIIMFSKDDEKA